MPSMTVRTPKLSQEDLAEVAEALRQRAAGSCPADKRRLRRLISEGPLTDLFLCHAYVRYLHTTGKPASSDDFLKWLLSWIVLSQDAIPRFVATITKLYGV